MSCDIFISQTWLLSTLHYFQSEFDILPLFIYHLLPQIVYRFIVKENGRLKYFWCFDAILVSKSGILILVSKEFRYRTI